MEGQKIGTGRFSIVTWGRDPESGRIIAVKHLSTGTDTFTFLREVEHLAKLNHPCVVRIVGWAPPRVETGAEIQMEYAANRSLAHVLSKVQGGDIPAFWHATGIGMIICGLVLGMRFIHSRRIIHRDLKPSNILMDGDGHVWISDFGTSRSEDNDWTPTGEVGTFRYSAPELWAEDGIYTNKCDVFSFGLILYEVLVGEAVFPPSEPLMFVLKRLRARDLPKIPAKRGRVMQELIPKCWDRDPNARPSFETIFQLIEDRKFEIIPGANAKIIEEFCGCIVEWERINPNRS
jgi:serine/threonine protein kinase